MDLAFASAVASEFDGLAEHYDETRGGEHRGDEYAADIDRVLPPGDGPILEIGVGTGVVALGLKRRGRAVIGLDLSAPMLDRARPRLGPVLVRSNGMRMAVATASVAHAVSVWVVQSVRDPVTLFHEAARVIRPGGRYVVCVNQVPGPEDAVARIISEMMERIDVRRAAPRPRRVTTDEVLEWAAEAAFTGTVQQFIREWPASPSQELAAIAHASGRRSVSSTKPVSRRSRSRPSPRFPPCPTSRIGGERRPRWSSSCRGPRHGRPLRSGRHGRLHLRQPGELG
jgi:ubiquinone/menaquinone biosynthesis C-methylase UbiE